MRFLPNPKSSSPCELLSSSYFTYLLSSWDSTAPFKKNIPCSMHMQRQRTEGTWWSFSNIWKTDIKEGRINVFCMSLVTRTTCNKLQQAVVGCCTRALTARRSGPISNTGRFCESAMSFLVVPVLKFLLMEEHGRKVHQLWSRSYFFNFTLLSDKKNENTDGTFFRKTRRERKKHL